MLFHVFLLNVNIKGDLLVSVIVFKWFYGMSEFLGLSCSEE